MEYFPEGKLINTCINKAFLSSIESLKEAKNKDVILEGTAILCTKDHDLTVKINDRLYGIIKREEGALGIKEGTTRDIALITRVNKPVAFTVVDFKEIDGIITPVLSRRKAQEMCMKNFLEKLTPGDVIDAVVTHIEPFGIFCDIGCGISSFIPIDLISVSRIDYPGERFFVGQDIKAVVKKVEGERVFLSHKELLGTWEENAALFSPGETVCGVVRSIESYGIFVELMPNLAGLAEYTPDAHVGDKCSLYIKSILPEKMKIKLVIIDSFPNEEDEKSIKYFFTGHHMDRWQYSPDISQKLVETVF